MAKPYDEMTDGEFVGVPIKYIPRLTQIFVGKLETESTHTNCLCLWIVHPEDVEKPIDEARKRRTNAHPMCPIHTKEGLIGGFLKFVLDNPNVCLACPWGCSSCMGEDSCECYEHQNNHPDDSSDAMANSSFEEAMRDGD